MRRIAKTLFILGIFGQSILPGCTTTFLVPTRDAAVGSFAAFVGEAASLILDRVLNGPLS